MSRGLLGQPGPCVIHAWDDSGSPEVAFCVFKCEQTEMAGPMGNLTWWLAPEIHILSDTLL